MTARSAQVPCPGECGESGWFRLTSVSHFLSMCCGSGGSCESPLPSLRVRGLKTLIHSYLG